MPERNLSNTHVFSIRHLAALLTPRKKLDSTVAGHLRAILNREITHKKHKPVKKVTLKKP